MSDDFNPDTLLNDIDRIMEQQGYSSLSSAGEPVEVEAADAATLRSPGAAPSEEMMSRIDRVIHPEEAFVPEPEPVVSANPVAAAPTEPEPVISSKPETMTAAEPEISVQEVPVRSTPAQTTSRPDRPSSDPVESVAETVMPPDTEAAPMFTTIDEPIEWKLNENNSSKNVNIPEPEIIEDLPPVSYLEGASADGYQVENVAFGDISVGVETESVEFSVGHPLLRLLRNILICVAAALILSLLVTKFIAHHTTVDGSSMMPTLSDGDQLIVQQLSYYFHDPERFDVIVFPISTEDNYIKRVIGLPGETVQIIDGQVYINGNLLTDDRYGSERIQDPGNAADTIYLQADEYFVLGDNRNASVDSRFSEVGVIKRKDIKAKAWLRFYPFGSFGTVN